MKKDLLEKFSKDIQNVTSILKASEHGIYKDGKNTFIWVKLPDKEATNEKLDLLKLTWQV